MKKVHIEKSMHDCLLEALKNNAIITSDGLSSDEFIHTYGGKAYYEDGACLGFFSEAYELLDSQDWTHNHKWFIVGYLEETEIKALKSMRKSHKFYESAWYKRELNKILGNPFFREVV